MFAPITRAVRRAAIRALDGPGRRPLLGWLLTAYARAQGQRGARVHHDGEHWIRWSATGRASVDGAGFPYEALDISDLEERVHAYRAVARESWMPLYSPQAGDVVIDVGAGVGTDTLAFSELVGATGRVIAIEASPDTASMLRKTVALNGLSNVTVIERAVAAAEGIVHIEAREEHTASRLVERGVAPGVVAIRASALDDIVEELQLPQVDLLKVNIEGAERLLLEGAPRSLRLARNVSVAAHDFLWESTGDEWYRTRALVVDALQRAGFETLVRLDHPQVSVRDIVCGARVVTPPMSLPFAHAVSS